MRRRNSLIVIAFALILSILIIPIDSASAAVKDGTYKVQYEVKEKGKNNTSIADGYFSKPATVTVNGNTKTVQITLTGADMIKSLSVQGTPVTVVSDSGSTRVVKFNVSGDLSSRIPMSMHIVVPDLYDTTHGADLLLNVSGLASGGDGGSSGSSSGDGKVVDNPRTGDSTPIAMYVMLLIGAAGVFFVVRKMRPTGN